MGNSHNTDIGIDISMLSDRLRFVGDAYITEYNRYVYDRHDPSRCIWCNPPKGQLCGPEDNRMGKSLSWRDKFNVGCKAFSYDFRCTLADNKSKITRYNNPEKVLTDYYEGQVIGEIWGYETEGFFVDQQILLLMLNRVLR